MNEKSKRDTNLRNQIYGLVALTLVTVLGLSPLALLLMPSTDTALIFFGFILPIIIEITASILIVFIFRKSATSFPESKIRIIRIGLVLLGCYFVAKLFTNTVLILGMLSGASV